MCGRWLFESAVISVVLRGDGATIVFSVEVRSSSESKLETAGTARMNFVTKDYELQVLSGVSKICLPRCGVAIMRIRKLKFVFRPRWGGWQRLDLVHCLNHQRPTAGDSVLPVVHCSTEDIVRFCFR
jgi:hypothetical protein